MIQRMAKSGELTGVVEPMLGSLRYRETRDGTPLVTFKARFLALGPWVDGSEREAALSLLVTADPSGGTVHVAVEAVELAETYEEEGAHYDALHLETMPQLKAWAQRAASGLTAQSFGYSRDAAEEMREEIRDCLDGLAG